jgi:hypothetical protein
VVGYCEYGSESLSCIKGGDFRDYVWLLVSHDILCTVELLVV